MGFKPLLLFVQLRAKLQLQKNFFLLVRSTTIKSSFIYNFSISLKKSALRSTREPCFIFRCRINDTFSSTSQHIGTAAFHRH
jgi:hypothetical protein